MTFASAIAPLSHPSRRRGRATKLPSAEPTGLLPPAASLAHPSRARTERPITRTLARRTSTQGLNGAPRTMPRRFKALVLSELLESAILKLIHWPRIQSTVFALVDDQNIIIVEVGIMTILQQCASNFHIVSSALLVPPASRHWAFLYRGRFRIHVRPSAHPKTFGDRVGTSHSGSDRGDANLVKRHC
jgi:hypothetical protein